MSDFKKITEQAGPHRNLEQMSTGKILSLINEEDGKVAEAVKRALPQVEKLVEAVTARMSAGGRLFYIGAGTSGRLGVLDASECPPTFGIPHGQVIALIAGGEKALTAAVEGAEDNREQGWLDLQEWGAGQKDVVVGIASSGTTPYVLAALEECGRRGIVTGCITNNPGSPVARAATFPIEVPVGPELLTGSTRMKGGTAQKMVLNMISTTVMIRLGRVEDNHMVHLEPTNEKLLDRGARILMDRLGLADYDRATALMRQYRSVKKAINGYKKGPGA